MRPNSKIWTLGFFVIAAALLALAACSVVEVDPFFHYHAPYTDRYYYTLDNQRSQNDGIIKHFSYDAVLTGSSMLENSKTSEMDAIFGTHAIKTISVGGTYKEINDNLAVALACNPNVKTVVRGLDTWMFMLDKDAMRDELGTYPTYLYDDCLLNDVEYLFNRDVVFNRVFAMKAAAKAPGFQPGITSFDEYAYSMQYYTFGPKTVLKEPITAVSERGGVPVHLTADERQTVMDSAEQNIAALAREYPEVTFYYFITPYSIVWWKNMVSSGSVYRHLEAEQIIIEKALECDNIQMYSFNLLTDIVTDLNNYRDEAHYASWINSLMLRYMKDGYCLLTRDNYRQYLASELKLYTTFDYASLNDQPDYEDDYYAQTLWENRTTKAEPFH